MSRYDLIDFEWRVIERFFSKLFRRVATRYDKHAANFLAMVQLASMRLWLRAYTVYGLRRCGREGCLRRHGQLHAILF